MTTDWQWLTADEPPYRDDVWIAFRLRADRRGGAWSVAQAQRTSPSYFTVHKSFVGLVFGSRYQIMWRPLDGTPPPPPADAEEDIPLLPTPRIYTPAEQLAAHQQLVERLEAFRTLMAKHFGQPKKPTYEERGMSYDDYWSATESYELSSGTENNFWYMSYPQDGWQQFHVPDEVLLMSPKEMEAAVLEQVKRKKRNAKVMATWEKEHKRFVRKWQEGNSDIGFFDKEAWAERWKVHPDVTHPKPDLEETWGY